MTTKGLKCSLVFLNVYLGLIYGFQRSRSPKNTWLNSLTLSLVPDQSLPISSLLIPRPFLPLFISLHYHPKRRDIFPWMWNARRTPPTKRIQEKWPHVQSLSLGGSSSGVSIAPWWQNDYFSLLLLGLILKLLCVDCAKEQAGEWHVFFSQEKDQARVK